MGNDDGALKAAAKRVLRRAPIDEALDRTRFAIDTFPRKGPLKKLSCVGYQPLPWVGLNGSREHGSWTRWDAIATHLDEVDPVETALDLGCNIGFFTLSLASRGIDTIGVENNPVSYRTALYAINHSDVGNAGVLVLDLSPSTAKLLPEVDVVLCLSLWHHVVHEQGLDAASEFLRTVWSRTRRTLFFDTGEREMPREFDLPPMEPEPRTWLEDYLRETCEGGEPVHLGLHEAFDLDGNPTERNLFAVDRAA